jgi:hypothetical protein
VVLFYNKTLFTAAGVEAPTADWTWADEQAAAQKLTDKAAGVWGDYQPIAYNEYYKALACRPWPTARAPRFRLQAVLQRQARHVAHRHLDVQCPRRRAVRVGRRGRAG